MNMQYNKRKTKILDYKDIYARLLRVKGLIYNLQFVRENVDDFTHVENNRFD